MSTLQDSKQDDNGVDIFRQINNINDLIKNHESVIKSLQLEVDFYKKEHGILKQEIYNITKVKQESIKNPDELKNYVDTIITNNNTDNVLNNLNHQIRILTEEKDRLNNLWKTSEKTILNLEIETAEYKRQLRQPNSILELKKGYTNAIKVLESNIINLKNELDKQNQLNTTILDEKVKAEKTLNSMEKKYQEILAQQTQSLEHIRLCEQTIDSLKLENTNLLHQCNELEKSLAQSNIAIKEYVYRESKALEKIQESLCITEMAISEKDIAVLREKEIQEERDYLATTIDQVMDDAVKKYEQEINIITQKYFDKIQILENCIKKLQAINETQTQQIELSEQSAKQLENKLENVFKNNQSLDSELQIASHAIIELEMKIEAFENLMNREQETNKLCETSNIELQEFLTTNKRLREKWKVTVDDTIEKLQKEIKMIQQKYFNLQIENEQLKSKFVSQSYKR